jgi:hypothetical protein
MRRIMGRALLVPAILALAVGTSGAGVALVEPGHTLNQVADSVFPSHPSQTDLDTKGTLATSTIESIGINSATGMLFVQLTGFSLATGSTSCIFSVSPTGVVTLINAGTGFTVNSRGADLQYDPSTNLLLTEDSRALLPDRIASVNPAGGAVGTYATADNLLSGTFGMDFSAGIGGSDVPAGEVVFTSDVGGNGIHSAPMGGPFATHLTPPVAGDDMVIQPNGDWVHVPDFNGIMTAYSPSPPHTATPSPTGLDIEGMFTDAGLAFVCGSRATVCDITGDIFVSSSCFPGGRGIFRVDASLSTSTHVLTITDEGLQDLILGPATSGLGNSVYFSIHDTASGGEEVWEMTVPECVCDANPRSQGYWHRQCLGAGLITAGRNGRGPAEPTEPDFLKSTLGAVDLQLQNTINEFATCEDGIDTNPPSDPCERAKKQYTALLLNVETGRLAPGCGIDLSGTGCSSGTIAALVEEAAGLINSGDPDNCKLAAECAGAANEGNGVLPFSAPASSAPSGSGDLQAQGDSDLIKIADASDTGAHSESYTVNSPGSSAISKSGTTRTVAPTKTAEAPSSEPETPRLLLDASAAEPVGALESKPREKANKLEAAPVTGEKALFRHLAALSEQTTSETRRRDAEDALLTALGGGYEPSMRFDIVRLLIGKVDVAYESLLARHLEDISLEAREAGDQKLARKAERLLEKLEPTGNTER